MEIVENLAEWSANFRNGWLAHYQQTGQTDFKQYSRPKNQNAPAGLGIDLSKSRLIFISSAGAYVANIQEPFDAPNPLGDYTIRTFPLSIPFDALAYAHTHYDHTAITADPQVLLPLRHLQDMVVEGIIGEVAPTVVSFGGYQPDVTRVLDETIPLIMDVVHQEQAHAALLVPA